MNELKQINITDWLNNKRIKFLTENKEDVVLIDEESVYYVLPCVQTVIEETSSRHEGSFFYKYSVADLIEQYNDMF